jgi:hypothetical protein
MPEMEFFQQFAQGGRLSHFSALRQAEPARDRRMEAHPLANIYPA